MTEASLILITHVVILVTAVFGAVAAGVGAVSSILNRKKLNEIHISVNGGLTERIAQAIKEAKET